MPDQEVAWVCRCEIDQDTCCSTPAPLPVPAHYMAHSLDRQGPFHSNAVGLSGLNWGRLQVRKTVLKMV